MNKVDVDLLVLQHTPLVLDVVKGIVARGVPEHIAKDDLIQHCTLHLFDAITAYRGENGASLRTYLQSVIRNKAQNFIKRERSQTGQWVRGKFDGDDADAENCWHERVDYSRDQGDRSNTYTSSEAEHRLLDWERIAELVTPEQLQALQCCYRHGKTQEEAAAELGITREALASRLRKAIPTLRREKEKIVRVIRYQNDFGEAYMGMKGNTENGHAETEQ